MLSESIDSTRLVGNKLVAKVDGLAVSSCPLSESPNGEKVDFFACALLRLEKKNRGGVELEFFCVGCDCCVYP